MSNDNFKPDQLNKNIWFITKGEFIEPGQVRFSNENISGLVKEYKISDLAYYMLNNSVIIVIK